MSTHHLAVPSSGPRTFAGVPVATTSGGMTVPGVTVLPAASIPSRQWLDAVFRTHGLPLPIVQISANSIPLLPALILRTGLLSFISRRTVERGSDGVLKEVPLAGTTLQRTLGVTYRSDAYLSPAARRLIAILQAGDFNEDDSQVASETNVLDPFPFPGSAQWSRL